MRRIVSLAVAVCAVASCQRAAWRDETITALDYAFRAPATLPSGPTVFRFVNAGKQAHEVQLFRFNRTVDVAAANRWLASGHVPDSVADMAAAVLIAPPGQDAPERVWIDLKPGELYALMCQFRDSAGKPQHASMGMVALLHISQ